MPTLAKKKVFISDIHLGDAKSLDKPHHYGRCKTNIKHLSEFLNKLLQSEDVAEVVILGDLFDRWVIPADQEPLISFEEIFNTTENLEVMEALKHLAAKLILTYVPGNHDMILPMEKPADIEQFIKSYIHKNIRYEQKYQRGTIVGEHGHYYALFNAPYLFPDGIPPSLPIGYFISRLEATKSLSGEKEDNLYLYLKYVPRILEQIGKANFIPALFTAMADDVGLKESAPINMKGIPGFPATVKEIGNLYKELIKEWQMNRQDLDWSLSVAGDIGRLLLAAAMIYFAPGGPDPDIVIFGHTHGAKLLRKYDFNSILDRIVDDVVRLPITKHIIRETLKEPLRHIHDRVISILETTVDDLAEGLPISKPMAREILKEAPIVPFDISIPLPDGRSYSLPCRSIYANCGTWVDDKQLCTYVETQEDFEHERHYVRLFSYYPDKKLMQEAYCNLKR